MTKRMMPTNWLTWLLQTLPDSIVVVSLLICYDGYRPQCHANIVAPFQSEYVVGLSLNVCRPYRRPFLLEKLLLEIS